VTNRVVQFTAADPTAIATLPKPPRNGGQTAIIGKQRLREKGVVQARVRQVEACVASVFGVPHESLRASTRGKADVARARQVAMYLCHTVLGFSLTTVGDQFERDRTTVGHACRLVEDLRDRSVFDDQIAYLERAVLAGCLTLVVRTDRPNAAQSREHAYA
jgi:hypothetical protein